MRLNQFLAKSLGISRRQADAFIEHGDVEVHGELGQFHTQVPEKGSNVRIFRNDKWVDIYGKKRGTTMLMYKPIFTLVTKTDPQKRQTIYNILPPKYHDVKPAGRLDYLSEGLLVLSDNGDFLNELTHPSYETEKKYLVGLDSPLSDEHIRKMGTGGIELDEYELVPVQVHPVSFSPLNLKELKPKPTQLKNKRPERISTKPNQAVDLSEFTFLKPQRNFTWYQFTLKEGRKNQIRRMCELFGHKVLRLIRIEHGGYKLDERLYKQRMYEVKGK